MLKGMNARLLSYYHRLPPAGRSAVASLRGLYLHQWRYGRETEALVEQALSREAWSPERWKTWQEERLAFVLHRAATSVPYYREYWAQCRRHGDRKSWEILENWPILDKETLRRNPTAFVADDSNIRWMFHEHTSGTTGKPLDLWWSKQTVRAWYALFEARLRRWNGVSLRDSWAILGGQPIASPNASRPPFWVWNAPMKQLYLSANHVNPRWAPDYLNAIANSGATHLVAYSSSVSFLAGQASPLGCQFPELRVVLTNAEPLFPWQRDLIREGLGCAVRETYGMAEAVAAASECPEQTMHLWPEVGWVELIDDIETAPVLPGTAGRLVCTGLLNADMPLIRYEVGDRARIATSTICKCGRKLPAIAGIEGRTNDLLIARDGRRVYWLNPIFYGIPIREAQIVQESLDLVRVRYVPAPEFTAGAARSITERLQSRMGRIQVILDRVEEVPRMTNGKFRAVVCEIRPGSGR